MPCCLHPLSMASHPCACRLTSPNNHAVELQLQHSPRLPCTHPIQDVAEQQGLNASPSTQCCRTAWSRRRTLTAGAAGKTACRLQHRGVFINAEHTGRDNVTGTAGRTACGLPQRKQGEGGQKLRSSGTQHYCTSRSATAPAAPTAHSPMQPRTSRREQGHVSLLHVNRFVLKHQLDLQSVSMCGREGVVKEV